MFVCVWGFKFAFFLFRAEVRDVDFPLCKTPETFTNTVAACFFSAFGVFRTEQERQHRITNQSRRHVHAHVHAHHRDGLFGFHSQGCL